MADYRPRHRPGHDVDARHRCSIAAADAGRHRAAGIPAASIPQPGWVEHDPEEIWATTRRDRRARRMARAGRRAADVAAIGITNQRETTVVWDRATGDADPQRHRLAGPAHAPTPAQALRGDGAEPTGPARRPACCSIPISPPPSSPGCSTTSPGARAARRARRARLRHRRQLPALAADRRRACTPPTPPTPRARCSSTSTRGAGTTSCCALLRRAARDAARGARLRRRLRRDRAGLFGGADRRSAASPATSRRRPSARPASRRAW